MDYIIGIDFEVFVQEVLLFLGSYGFIIVIIFGIMHPLFESPLSLLNLALAFEILGFPFGFLLVFSSNIVGILLLYYFAYKFNEKSNNFLFRKRVSEKALDWVRTTATWRHILVIGVPLVPTYPVKIAVPLSKVGFKKYLITLVGAYVFLYFGNFLIYFGLLGFITDNIPNYVSFILLSVFVIYIYTGNRFFKRTKLHEKAS